MAALERVALSPDGFKGRCANYYTTEQKMVGVTRLARAGSFDSCSQGTPATIYGLHSVQTGRS